ncbi:MAG: helix-turn-helix transcriptional regulator [Candidatus Izemoplasmatales bacterium]|nr:helix-turn-helix transcriptional regulator [Candidatus Izemoplasmatales bacterium]
MDWGSKVKEYREKYLFTQQEMADILKVGVASVARWENGYCQPTTKVKRKIKYLLLDGGIKLED